MANNLVEDQFDQFIENQRNYLPDFDNKVNIVDREYLDTFGQFGRKTPHEYNEHHNEAPDFDQNLYQNNPGIERMPDNTDLNNHRFIKYHDKNDIRRPGLFRKRPTGRRKNKKQRIIRRKKVSDSVPKKIFQRKIKDDIRHSFNQKYDQFLRPKNYRLKFGPKSNRRFGPNPRLKFRKNARRYYRRTRKRHRNGKSLKIENSDYRKVNLTDTHEGNSTNIPAVLDTSKLYSRTGLVDETDYFDQNVYPDTFVNSDLAMGDDQFLSDVGGFDYLTNEDNFYNSPYDYNFDNSHAYGKIQFKQNFNEFKKLPHEITEANTYKYEELPYEFVVNFQNMKKPSHSDEFILNSQTNEKSNRLVLNLNELPDDISSVPNENSSKTPVFTHQMSLNPYKYRISPDLDKFTNFNEKSQQETKISPKHIKFTNSDEKLLQMSNISPKNEISRTDFDKNLHTISKNRQENQLSADFDEIIITYDNSSEFDVESVDLVDRPTILNNDKSFYKRALPENSYFNESSKEESFNYDGEKTFSNFNSDFKSNADFLRRKPILRVNEGNSERKNEINESNSELSKNPYVENNSNNEINNIHYVKNRRNNVPDKKYYVNNIRKSAINGREVVNESNGIVNKTGKNKIDKQNHSKFNVSESKFSKKNTGEIKNKIIYGKYLNSNRKSQNTKAAGVNDYKAKNNGITMKVFKIKNEDRIRKRVFKVKNDHVQNHGFGKMFEENDKINESSNFAVFGTGVSSHSVRPTGPSPPVYKINRPESHRGFQVFHLDDSTPTHIPNIPENNSFDSVILPNNTGKFKHKRPIEIIYPGRKKFLSGVRKALHQSHVEMDKFAMSMNNLTKSLINKEHGSKLKKSILGVRNKIRGAIKNYQKLASQYGGLMENEPRPISRPHENLSPLRDILNIENHLKFQNIPPILENMKEKLRQNLNGLGQTMMHTPIKESVGWSALEEMSNSLPDLNTAVTVMSFVAFSVFVANLAVNAVSNTSLGISFGRSDDVLSRQKPVEIDAFQHLDKILNNEKNEFSRSKKNVENEKNKLKNVNIADKSLKNYERSKDSKVHESFTDGKDRKKSKKIESNSDLQMILQLFQDIYGNFYNTTEFEMEKIRTKLLQYLLNQLSNPSFQNSDPLDQLSRSFDGKGLSKECRRKIICLQSQFKSKIFKNQINIREKLVPFWTFSLGYRKTEDGTMGPLLEDLRAKLAGENSKNCEQIFKKCSDKKVVNKIFSNFRKKLGFLENKNDSVVMRSSPKDGFLRNSKKVFDYSEKAFDYSENVKKVQNKNLNKSKNTIYGKKYIVNNNSLVNNDTLNNNSLLRNKKSKPSTFFSSHNNKYTRRNDKKYDFGENDIGI